MANEEKRQLSKVWERVHDDEDKINNTLKIINVKSQDVAFIKRERTIRLLDRELIPSSFASQSLVVDYIFSGLNERWIPHIRAFSLLETEDAYELDEFLVFTKIVEWKQIASDTFRFRHIIRGAHTHELPGGGLVGVPLYVTVDLVFFNDNVWHEVQQKKG